jgi:hypothetical protein
MDEEREMELELDKVYTLPDFEYIEYDGRCLAIAPEIAKWIVLENNEQYEILTMFAGGSDLQTVLEQFEENQGDVIAILTQLEAKHVECVVLMSRADR